MKKKILFPSAIFILVILFALTWQQCGYWKNSIKLWNHSCLVTNNNYFFLADALAEKGKFEEAIDNYNKDIRVWPDFYFSYCGRGLAYYKLGQYQLAIEDYNHAIRLKSDYADAYYKRGIIYGEMGQHRLAIEDFNKAIRISSTYVFSFNNRGSTYANQGQYQKAIEYYNEAIHLQPYNALIYNNRGAAYLEQGNKNLGCQDLQKACELGECKTLERAKDDGNCN